jgi:hypothetical protein
MGQGWSEDHRSDNTRVVMIHLRIHADKFEDYVCEEHHYGSELD